MFIGDGAKLVRDAFALAKEKSPAIIFIDELDAIGTKVCVIDTCRDDASVACTHRVLRTGQHSTARTIAFLCLSLPARHTRMVTDDAECCISLAMVLPLCSCCTFSFCAQYNHTPTHTLFVHATFFPFYANTIPTLFASMLSFDFLCSC